MLAKIVHILTALPDPDMPEIKELETLFYKFLWNKKPDKIKREIIVQKLEDGGLNMPDVKQFIKSLKISWIRRFHQSNATWRLILISLQDLPLFDRTLQCGLVFLLKLRIKTRNKFWQDALTSTHTFARKIKGDTFLFVCLVGFLTSSSTTRLYRGRAPRQERLTILRAATHETELGDHDFCLSRSHYTDTDPTCRDRAATAGIEPGTSSPGVARSTAELPRPPKETHANSF